MVLPRHGRLLQQTSQPSGQIISHRARGVQVFRLNQDAKGMTKQCSIPRGKGCGAPTGQELGRSQAAGKTLLNLLFPQHHYLNLQISSQLLHETLQTPRVGAGLRHFMHKILSE